MLAETLNQFNLSAFKTRKDYAKASFNLPDNFPEKHIELRDFSPESIVILKNGDLVVIYEINGIYDEVLDQDGLTEKIHSFMKGFRSVGTGIPSHLNLRNTTVQLILKQREIKSPLKNHTYSESTVGKILQQEEKELFKRGLVKKDFYITIRFAPENTTKRSSGFFYPLRSTFIKSQNDQLNQFLQTYETFKNELTNFERHFPALLS